MTRRWGVGGLIVALPLVAASSCDSGTESGNRQRQATASTESCYSRTRVTIPAPVPTRAVFVVIDQTTGLDERLRETVTSNLRRLLGPGTTYSIATFSAYGRGNYAQISATGAIDAPPPDDARSGQSVRSLERLDRCLPNQQEAVSAQAMLEIESALGGSATAFTHSEIMASLRQIAQAVRSSPARDKLVIVVSDLLEHSRDRSFYADRQLRLIDPEAELASSVEKDLLADFGGARIAVVGAGFLSPESREDAVRDRASLTALRTFWEAWFARSRGEILRYGEPDLMTPLAWSSEAPATDEAS